MLECPCDQKDCARPFTVCIADQDQVSRRKLDLEPEAVETVGVASRAIVPQRPWRMRTRAAGPVLSGN